MTTHQRKITVIGHKNPDTDSVCSAIAYAELKNRLESTDLYVPRRAGAINAETRFVLKHFKVDVPELVEDVGTTGVYPVNCAKKIFDTYYDMVEGS